MNKENIWKWAWLFLIIVVNVVLLIIMLNTNGSKIKSSNSFSNIVSEVSDNYSDKVASVTNGVKDVTNGLFSSEEREAQAQVKALEAEIAKLKLSKKVVLKPKKEIKAKVKSVSLTKEVKKHNHTKKEK